MSHVIYEGLVTKDNLGPEFDQSTAPIKVKTGSGLLKDPVTGVITVDPAFVAANTPPPVADIFTNAATYSAGNLTIKDNNAGTPDVVVDLGDLKRVAIANTASVVLSGTGEAATPLAATVTAIPAGVPIPAGQLSGVVPSANTTNVLAVTGPNLVSTVNGVASSLPMASIVPATTVSNTVAGTGAAKTLTTTVNGVAAAPVSIADLDAQSLSISGNVISLTNGGSVTLPAAPATTVSTVTTGSGAGKTLTTVVNGVSATTTIGDADNQALSISGNVISLTNGGSVTIPSVPATTHVNGWTKAGGLTESVDGVASNIAIASGAVSDLLGYNAAGFPVHEARYYSYRSPFPAPAVVQLPSNVGGTGNIADGTTWFRVQDGNYSNPLTLPPVSAASVPITIERLSAFGVSVAGTNTVHGSPIPIAGGEVVRFVPTSLGWRWIDGEINTPVIQQDFWRSGGTLLPDGTNDTTETIAHDGRVKIGGGTQATPPTALTVVNSGVSVVVPASGGGAIISDPTSSRIYLEHQSAPPAGRVMSLRSEGGISTFASVSDSGAAFVVDSILGMTHSNGNIRFGAYPNTRNDSGTPVNILSTDVNGNLRSDPIADLLSTRTEIRETFVSTAGSLSMPAPTLASSPGLDLWTMQTLVEVTAVGTIALPAIPAALAPFLIGVEIDIKAFGSWVGAVTVATPAGVTIDNAATYVFSKVAGLQPSISVRYTGSKWLVV